MSLEEYGINPAETVGLISAGAIIGGVAVRAYMRSLLCDEGHRVYIAPDFDALQAVISVCEANGLDPAREIVDERVVQALMKDNSTVFLVAQPNLLTEMGNPSAAPMLKVKNPMEAALRTQSTLSEAGFTGEVIDPLGDQVKGEMVFVKTNALDCGLIGFREHVVKMGPKPPKWDPQKKLGFKNPA